MGLPPATRTGTGDAPVPIEGLATLVTGPSAHYLSLEGMTHSTFWIFPRARGASSTKRRTLFLHP
jgi:hypothetical protein